MRPTILILDQQLTGLAGLLEGIGEVHLATPATATEVRLTYEHWFRTEFEPRAAQVLNAFSDEVLSPIAEFVARLAMIPPARFSGPKRGQGGRRKRARRGAAVSRQKAAALEAFKKATAPRWSRPGPLLGKQFGTIIIDEVAGVRP